MKQLDILDKIVTDLKKDNSTYGVMLMGSVADGSATEISDLDIMILCDIDKFEANYVDGCLVEYNYMNYETALYKLQNNDMDVYHYIHNKILFDNGQLQELMSIAYEKYHNYITKPEVKKRLYHWLVSARIKLQSAISRQDVLKMNYLTATSSWKLIEAIWAVNDKPVPPSGSVIKFLPELNHIPSNHWFEELFDGNDKDKTMSMIFDIDWVLPLLKQKQQ